jgi:hypothetical protein
MELKYPKRADKTGVYPAQKCFYRFYAKRRCLKLMLKRLQRQ